MEFLHRPDFSASATPISEGFLVIISNTQGMSINLMLLECVQIKRGMRAFLRDQIERAENLRPLDAREIRKNVSSHWGSLMTKHLTAVHELLDLDDSDKVAYTAWKYATLTSWGEASAAREISLELKTSIHTIHYRLKLARDRGILSSPGPGSRLGK